MLDANYSVGEYAGMTLSDFMAQSKMTEAEIGRLAGCSQSTVNKLRNGRAAPSLALASRIARITGGRVTPNDFMLVPFCKDEAAA